MPSYTPPLRDMQFVLHELLHVVDELGTMPRYSQLDEDTVNAVLKEGGKFAAEVLQPINLSGDAAGCTFNPDDHSVTTPKGFKAAYEQYVAGGWTGLTADAKYGGQELPMVVDTYVTEMLNSANQAWTMYPALAHGVYGALQVHGSDEQKKTYLGKLASGQWMGTMCLTEPQCGTDLGLIKTHAKPQADGSYVITGTKIFISAGEHDLAENIIHLVLARLPDAPEGSKGISMFVVPKFKVGADGQLGERNPVYCTAIENKMGIHGNATCQISLDGATGYLVGEPNKGLQAMFVMMNGARMGVGNQSVGLVEVAYQNALAYARDRLQMRSLSGVKAPDKPADPIIVHPDVRRMLMTAKACAEGGRALTAYCAFLMDKATWDTDPGRRKEAEQVLALLTPIVKGFITENAFTAVSDCMQVYGGHGYIHDNGMEQFVRDARINLIYEGTNTIQALDLLGRKVLGDRGAALNALGQRIAQFIQSEQDNEAMAAFIAPLAELLKQFNAFAKEIGAKAAADPNEVGAAAFDFLQVAGHAAFAYVFALMASVAQAKIKTGSTDPFYKAKLQTARFYFSRMLPYATAAMLAARAGAAPLMETEQALA